MNAILNRKSQSDEFNNAMREFLSGENTGHLGTYMYADDQNDHRWKAGHSAPTYYLATDEKASLTLVLKDIMVSANNFVDLGPGGSTSVISKSLPLMKAVQAKNYYPIDISPTLANEALVAMKKETGVGGSVIITDFFNHIPSIKKNAFLSIMGGTIGNLDTQTDPKKLQQRLAHILSVYRKATDNRSYLFFSFDANTNAKEIVECYDNPQFGELVRSCIERAIDTTGFDYHVVWTPENYQLATGLRANRDQIIKFDGEDFAIEKDEYFPVLNSYRFPVNFVKEAAIQSGWVHQQTWSATGRVHYMLFAAQPNQFI